MERMAPEGFEFLEIIHLDGVSHDKYKEVEKENPGMILVQDAYRSNGEKLPKGYIGIYALSDYASRVRRIIYRMRIADGTLAYAGHQY